LPIADLSGILAKPVSGALRGKTGFNLPDSIHFHARRRASRCQGKAFLLATAFGPMGIGGGEIFFWVFFGSPGLAYD
jgi:hypothetical protein